MQSVFLTSEGMLTDQDGVPVADALSALAATLRLAPDCTLRSFFSLLTRYPALHAISQFLSDALSDAGQCPRSGCRSDEIALLVIGKTMELIGFPGKPRAELYLWLRGLEQLPAAEDRSGDEPPPEGRESPYSLAALMEANKETRFIPLQIVLDTPLYLGGLKHVVLGDVDRNLFCESRFTLFEVVDGLAWEFGFRGGTQQCSLGR